MGVATAFSAVRMAAIEALAVMGGMVHPVSGQLVLTRKNGTTFDAGLVRGSQWGQTGVWIIGSQPNVPVTMFSGNPPIKGDLILTSNGFNVGGVYMVTAGVGPNNADLIDTGWNIRGPQGVAANEPHAVAVMYKAQTINTGTWTACDFWSPEISLHQVTMSEGPEARTNFRPAVGGLYDIHFSAMFRNDVNSNGIRGVAISVGGTLKSPAYGPPVAAQADYVNVSTHALVRITANQWMQFVCMQTTGSPLMVHSAPYTQFSLRRVGP